MNEEPVQVSTLKAVRFCRPMSSGRTKPCLLACADVSGVECEVVVKLGGQEMPPTSMVCEIMAALLARDLGLATPEPVVVEVDAGFHACVPSELPEWRQRFRESHGRNYGSLFVGGGTATWPVDRRPTADTMDTAADIMLFDAIIMNPDRRADNPNLLHTKSAIYVYDHEMAFSFLRMIASEDGCPWRAGTLGFLGHHAFSSAFRGKCIDWGRPMGRFLGIPKDRLESYTTAVPSDWDPGGRTARRIVEYLSGVKEHANDLVLNLTGVLA